MSKPGAYLQNYNNELVHCIEKLRDQVKQLNNEISKEEESISHLEEQIRGLENKREQMGNQLARKIDQRGKLKITLAEAETAYLKILESSQYLLKMLKQETATLDPESNANDGE